MEKHFKYELDSGKIVNVPLVEVDSLKSKLKISTNEAIMLWLEDNGYEINEELEELDTKAKKQVKNVVKSNTERKKVVRERKPNPTKENIIKALADFLPTIASNVQVENIGKLITFTVDCKEFKLDLVEKRQPKK